MQRHAAPSDPVLEEGVLGGQVRQPPGRGRCDREVLSGCEVGPIRQYELDMLRQFLAGNAALKQRKRMSWLQAVQNQ